MLFEFKEIKSNKRVNINNNKTINDLPDIELNKKNAIKSKYND